MKSESALVSYDELGVFELESELLPAVAGGWAISLEYSGTKATNHTCGNHIDQNCTKPTNSSCVDPNGVCGNDVGCTSASVGG